MRKLFTIILGLILTVIAASWLTSVAYGHNNDTVSLNGETLTGIQITPAAAENTPSATFYGNAINGITPGELFNVDAAEVDRDIAVTLYLTNTEELVTGLRYMNLEVAVYKETTPGHWEKALLPDGNDFPALFLTMNNGMVNFDLPGLTDYKVVIERGNCRSHPAKNGQADIAPSFYLEATSL